MSNINGNEKTFKCEPASYHFQPQCYETHDLNIERVCHHCGKAMSPNAFKYNLQMHWFPWLYASTEFIELGLSPDNDLAHCKDCWHKHIRCQWIIVLGLLALMFWVISGWLALQSKVIIHCSIWEHILCSDISFIISSIFGEALSILFIWSLYGLYQDRAHYYLTPIIGTSPEISVNEVVKGNITLDPNGNYKGEINGRLGVLTYKVWPDPDNGKTKTNKDHAGFILLESGMDLRFEDSTSEEQPNVIKLESPPQWGGLKKIWKKDVKFNPQPVFGNTNILPIQIVPIITPQLGNEGQTIPNGLELIVQITPEFINSDLVKGEVRIVHFELKADQKLRGTESIYPAEAERERTRFSPFVRWENILWKTVNPNMPCKTFFVRYSGSIEQAMVFKGSIAVEFNRSISDIKNLRLFCPTGYERKETPHCECKTVVTADFEFHLQKWVIQEPIFNNFQVKNKDSWPDHKMISQIISNLSSNPEYYIQRVIENPPHTNKANARVINRLWDIGGRWYDKLYSINFHIVVTGKEVYKEGEDTPQKGETIFDITLQAITINYKVEENGVRVEKNELKDKVEAVKENIGKVIAESQKTVSNLPPSAPSVNRRSLSITAFPPASP